MVTDGHEAEFCGPSFIGKLAEHGCGPGSMDKQLSAHRYVYASAPGGATLAETEIVPGPVVELAVRLTGASPLLLVNV